MRLATPPHKTLTAIEMPKRETKTNFLEDEGSPTATRHMTLDGESRKEAIELTTLLSTRRTLICTWNVRTMYETGKMAQVTAAMKKNNLTILGISETRWTQVGQRKLTTGELLLYSGHEESNASHTQGVGLMLSKQAQRALIGWEVHGPRINTESFTRR